MALYDFKCDKCGKIQERFVKMSEADDASFPCECGEGEQKLSDEISAAALQFKGAWFKTRGHY